jgi:hypothetical protein
MRQPTRSPVNLRREALRASLPTTVSLLKRRQAAEIAQRDIEDYVALDWLEWHGGGLRLTVTGDNICKQLYAPVRDPGR